MLWSCQFDAIINWFRDEGVDVYGEYMYQYSYTGMVKNIQYIINKLQLQWTMGTSDASYYRYYTSANGSYYGYLENTNPLSGIGSRATLYIK